MIELLRLYRDAARSLHAGWNRFWFAARSPETLGLIRILAGLMMLYTHLVWTTDFTAFFGPNAWISREALAGWPGREGAWTHFAWTDSMPVLWTLHLIALVAMVALAAGLFTRVASIAAFLFTVSYANRVPGALFGLDQVNTMLGLYLMLGPSGEALSIDAWLRRRRGLPIHRPSVDANIAIRLMQVHLCIVYLFSGVGKLRGDRWWDGTALWGAIANLEYQSIDITWLAEWPLAINLLTQITVAWELFYIALIWPRATRPFMLALAIPLHLGIAVFLGMITFGLAMLIANLAFVPSWVLVAAWPGVFSGQGRGAAPIAATPIAANSPARQRRGSR